MARPQTRLGEWGKITLTGYDLDDEGRRQVIGPNQTKADTWRARAKVRDLDGRTRDVEAWARTKAAAQRTLTTKLHNRMTPAPAHAVVKPTTKLADAAQIWLTDLEASGLSANTRKVYTSSCHRHIIGTAARPSPIANLTVREVTVGGVERALNEIARTSGKSAAKMAKTVLTGVLGLATKYDAIPHNPARSAGPISVRTTKTSTRETDRSFTPDEQTQALAFAATDPTCVRRQLGDLMSFLAGTGARIGEACALRWSSLDLSAGTAKLGPVVVREKGKPVYIQEAGKSATSTRTIKLHPTLVARLMDRKVNAPANEWDVVFPSPKGRLRDGSNTVNHVSRALTDAGFPWATGHTFRHTVATTLDLAGLSAREIANHLGHRKASMTQDVYMSRRTVSDRAPELLPV